MFAGTIVAMGSYGGLRGLDKSANISELYPPKDTPGSYAELMAPEEALALRKIDRQSVLKLRRLTGGERYGSKTLSSESGSFIRKNSL